MHPYDILMLIILASALIFGAIKGFAWQVASLASIVVSYLVASYFRNDVAQWINAQPPWNMFLAMLLLYFGTSLAIWMLFRLISSSIDKIRLKEFDRQLGAGFGLLKGAALCCIVTMFAMTLLGPNQKIAIAKSKSGRYIAQALAQAGSIMPNEVKEVIGPYLENVGQQLEQGRLAEDPVGLDGGPSTSGWPTSSGYPSSPGYSANQGNGANQGYGQGQGGGLGIDPIAAGSSILDRVLNGGNLSGSNSNGGNTSGVSEAQGGAGGGASPNPQIQPQYQPQPQFPTQPQPQQQPQSYPPQQPRLPQLPFQISDPAF
jgi:membrane protein required for colicin V production